MDENKPILLALEKVAKEQSDKIAEIVIKHLKYSLVTSVEHPTKLTESFRYEKLNNGDIDIYSTTPIPLFIDRGTKPHLILPKNKKALAFKSQSHSAFTKTGRKINFDDKVVAKEVHHPGTEADPFIEAAVFSASGEIKKMK